MLCLPVSWRYCHISYCQRVVEVWTQAHHWLSDELQRLRVGWMCWQSDLAAALDTKTYLLPAVRPSAACDKRTVCLNLQHFLIERDPFFDFV